MHDRGVPALAFRSDGAFTLPHFPHDTFEQVSVDKLAEIVASEVAELPEGASLGRNHAPSAHKSATSEIDRP